MCIIVAKDKNVAMPSNEIFTNCFNKNSDGAGFMFARKGVIQIRKGYMSIEDFLSAVEEAKLLEKEAAVFHFRIGTQGGNIPENTHPFPVSSVMTRLKTLTASTDMGIAHNGISKHFSEPFSYKTETDFSDTQKMITDFLAIKSFRESLRKGDSATYALIERLESTSRFAILTSSKLDRLGKGWEEYKGAFYSNKSYIAPKKEQPSRWGQTQRLCTSCRIFTSMYYGDTICHSCNVAERKRTGATYATMVKCLDCDVRFSKGYSSRVRCSSCSEKHSKKARKEAGLLDGTCANCSAPFTTAGYMLRDNKKYCYKRDCFSAGTQKSSSIVTEVKSLPLKIKSVAEKTAREYKKHIPFWEEHSILKEISSIEQDTRLRKVKRAIASALINYSNYCYIGEEIGVEEEECFDFEALDWALEAFDEEVKFCRRDEKKVATP